MSSSRLMYQDWIVSLGCDPSSRFDFKSLLDSRSEAETLKILQEEIARTELGEAGSTEPDARAERIIKTVHRAVSSLAEDEREFILLHYFMGRSYRQIATLSGRAVYKLEALNDRAIRELKQKLAAFVAEEFNLPQAKKKPCPICDSEQVAEINGLLSGKQESETWRKYIRLLADKFGLKIRSPQTLIGHCKFH